VPWARGQAPGKLVADAPGPACDTGTSMHDRPTPRSCHEILEIARDATQRDIALAYLRIAMLNHPGHPGDDEHRSRARLRFAQAAEAWAVLGHAMAIRGTGEDRDANALALFEQTLDRRALALAAQRLKADAIQRALMDDGCPQGVAWSAAQRAERRAALGVRPTPLEGGHAPPSAIEDGGPSPDDTGGGFADELPGAHDARLPERVAAAVADALLLVAITAVPALMLGRAMDWSAAAGERIALVALLVGGFAYHVKAETRGSATPGKRLLGLSVAALDGGPIEPRRAALRHGLRVLSLVMAGLGFATVLVTERRQALHDLLTATHVRTDGTDRPALVKALCALPAALAVGMVALSVAGGR
jgi:uncharacterized RDD family membrane protein YckC